VSILSFQTSTRMSGAKVDLVRITKFLVTNLRLGLNELSGGEKTLLAMSFILSTAAFKRRSLYIFDEVDAGKYIPPDLC
jgi:excinuclease UvrABC ATPase subunit